MSSLKIKLTDKNIKPLLPGNKPYDMWDLSITGFYLRVLTSGSKSFKLLYRVNGRQRSFSIGKFGDITSVQARDIAKKKMGDVANGIDIQAKKALAKQEELIQQQTTLKGFLEVHYEPWVLVERKAGKRTMKMVRSNFDHLLNRPLIEITKLDIIKWRTKKLKKGIAPATVNRTTTSIKGVITKAVEWGLISSNPLAGLKSLKEDSSPNVRYLLNEEMTSLRNSLGLRDLRIKTQRENHIVWCKARGYTHPRSLLSQKFSDHIEPMVLLAVNTGMRRGEIFNLKWSNINFSTKQLTVVGKVSKPGNTRYIPLNKEVLNTLHLWKKQADSAVLVFPNRVGTPFENINKAWRKLRNDAGIKNFRFHDLRHHFASMLVMKHVDLNTVRELLGHSDIKMTLRYAHLAPEHKAAAVAVLDC